MKIILSNGKKLDVLGVHGMPRTYLGVMRDCLMFIFDENTDINCLLENFSAENCKAVTILEDGGSVAGVHENYTIRIEVGSGYQDSALRDPIVSDTKVCWVTMAQSTMEERVLIEQQEAIDALLVASLEGV